MRYKFIFVVKEFLTAVFSSWWNHFVPMVCCIFKIDDLVFYFLNLYSSFLNHACTFRITAAKMRSISSINLQFQYFVNCFSTEIHFSHTPVTNVQSSNSTAPHLKKLILSTSGGFSCSLYYLWLLQQDHEREVFLSENYQDLIRRPFWYIPALCSAHLCFPVQDFKNN